MLYYEFIASYNDDQCYSYGSRCIDEVEESTKTLSERGAAGASRKWTLRSDYEDVPARVAWRIAFIPSSRYVSMVIS